MSKPVAFYFDYASPFAYMANTLLARRLPGAEIDYRPTYLRGLEAFSRGLPYSHNKLRYMIGDMARCAAHEGVPLAMPSVFPINGMNALRGALYAQAHGAFPAYHQAMFRAAWAEDRDVASKEVVIAVAAAAGLDAAAVARGIDDPAIKDQLRQVTAAAEARGIFGVPTFAVGDELFWGHDRLDYVQRAAAGGASE